MAMVSSTVSVPQVLPVPQFTPERSLTVPPREVEEDRRSSAAKGAIIGMLLGAGFWSALLVVILKH
jgi:hypothetical protein